MERTLIIQRLEDTINKLKTLKDEQFCYEGFVTEFDEVNFCGTVCCVMGYYPIWFEESKIKYHKSFGDIELVVKDNENKPADTALQEFHGVTFELIDHLFYGCSLELSDGNYLQNSLENDLKGVITIFETVLSLIQNSNELDHLLLLD